MPGAIKTWIQATRAPFFSASALPVVLGGAVAFQQGHFHGRHFVLALIGILGIHAGTNLMNDYFDHKSGDDEANVKLTPFSGGSRMIQEGVIPARRIFLAGMLSFAVAAAIGLYFLSRYGWPLLVIGGLGILGGYFYTAPPFKLGYRGWGEILVGILLGPLAVGGAYLVTAGSLIAAPLWISLPLGFLVANILIINEFPDYEADKSVHKNHLVVLLGRDRAVWLFAGVLLLTYLSLAGLIFQRLISPWAALLFLSLPLAIKAVNTAYRHHEDYQAMIPAQGLTIALHSIFGIGLSAVLFLAE